MIRAFVVLSLVMSASVAVAKTSNESTTDSAAKPVKEKKVCRIDVDDTTSRMRKRICRTVREEVKESTPGAGADAAPAE